MKAILEKLQNMDRGQKIKIVMVVVVLLFVLYLLPGLFSGPKPTPTATGTANIPTFAATTPTAAPTPPPAVKTLTASKIKPEDSKLLTAAEDSQKQYLKAVTQLKMLELQQKIVSAQKSIATETLEKVKAEHSTKAITQPAPKPTSLADYAKGLVKPITMPQEQEVPAVTDLTYKLLYVAKEGDHWQAILGSNGNFYNVSTGTVLPDGNKVVAITGTNVALEDKKGKKTMLSITPVI